MAQVFKRNLTNISHLHILKFNFKFKCIYSIVRVNIRFIISNVNSTKKMEAAFDAMKASLQTAIRTKRLASNPGNAVSSFMNEWKLYEGIFKFEKYAT